MNFLYQIVTSVFVYTLYEEPGEELSKAMKRYNAETLDDLIDIVPDLELDKEDMHILLYIKDLRNEKTRDITLSDRILDALFFDLEVTPEDYDTVEELVSAYKHC